MVMFSGMFVHMGVRSSRYTFQAADVAAATEWLRDKAVSQGVSADSTLLAGVVIPEDVVVQWAAESPAFDLFVQLPAGTYSISHNGACDCIVVPASVKTRNGYSEPFKPQQWSCMLPISVVAA